MGWGDEWRGSREMSVGSGETSVGEWKMRGEGSNGGGGGGGGLTSIC